MIIRSYLSPSSAVSSRRHTAEALPVSIFVRSRSIRLSSPGRRSTPSNRLCSMHGARPRSISARVPGCIASRWKNSVQLH